MRGERERDEQLVNMQVRERRKGRERERDNELSKAGDHVLCKSRGGVIMMAI